MTLVTLMPEQKGNSWLSRFEENGIKVVQLNQDRFNIFRCVSVLSRYVRRNNIDVIHSTGYQADLVNMLVREDVKKVSTQRCHPREIGEKQSKWTRPFLEWGHLQIIKRMDAVVACSLSLQNTFVNGFGINTFAVQNGVDTERFFPLSSQERAKIRQQLGIGDNERIFLVLGSLRPRKNVGLIISAFSHANLKNYRLLIVGNGPDEESLHAQAADNKCVTFTGHISTPLKYLQAADVLVSSSLNEGLPNTVLEAMACGIPSILSDIGPHLELLDNPDVGVSFKSDSEEELIDCIRESTSWDLNDKRDKIRKYAEQEFGISVLAKKYAQIYNQTI